MIEIAALLGWAAALVMAPLLYQFRLRMREGGGYLEQSKAENKALLNRILAREGYSPVFTEEGIKIDRPQDDSPYQILKPPFAAAEDRWAEEEEQGRMTLAQVTGAVVPDLTEAQKQEILQTYQN